MLCYKDRTFCNERCVNTDCNYKLSEDDMKNADEMNIDVCLAFLRGTDSCVGYIGPKNKNQAERKS